LQWILYIDNRSKVEMSDSEDEDLKERLERVNEKKRNKSKQIIFNHLEKNCNQIYKLKG
jgi:hypothetical protein